jgi:hypothetical protein
VMVEKYLEEYPDENEETILAKVEEAFEGIQIHDLALALILQSRISTADLRVEHPPAIGVSSVAQSSNSGDTRGKNVEGLKSVEGPHSICTLTNLKL